MTRDEVYAGLTDIFRDAFSSDQMVLRPEMTAADVPGWDSAKMVAIIIATEQRFDIHMRSREVDSLASVGDLARLVLAKQAK